jgi:lantibiotic modifying enzyme
MPNFSHGAAGIAYFLAELHQTQVGSAQASSPYLAGARRAARYLQSLSRDPCLVHHHTPGGENLYYLGYCHGPPGAARLFMTLHEIEPDAGWDAWLTRSADAILDTGIPDQSPGFWNNVGQCCGSAGLASFMLEMHRRTGDRKYMNAVRALTDDLLARATREETSDGRPTLKWIHAEHRIRPDFLQAQTGYMQGAAGIALWLLELDAHDNAQAARPPQLPDSPF